MKKTLIIFGTRPEFIKLIPVILEIRKRNLEKQFILIHTGQHVELIENLFKDFNINPDIVLKSLSEAQPVANLISKILQQLQDFINCFKQNNFINYILTQGDTASSFSAALIAFLNNIPLVHIEAGLRTNDFNHPFPEEYFRKVISMSSTVHFAPTLNAKNNLMREGVSEEKIIITGNTIVDFANMVKNRHSQANRIKINKIIITCHRRENQNGNFGKLVDMVKMLAAENLHLNFIWISHPNPFIKCMLKKSFFIESKNVKVLAPLNPTELYDLYRETKLIITDSGGMQEEAVSFGIPTMVLRKKTERIESIEKGYSRVVNFSNKKARETFNFFENTKPVFSSNPYGDGNASKRIINFFEREILTS